MPCGPRTETWPGDAAQLRIKGGMMKNAKKVIN